MSDCMWCDVEGCPGEHTFEIDVTSDTVTAAVEKAIREEREAVVRRLRELSKWFREIGNSRVGLRSDDTVADALEEEASFFERGEHRK